MRKFSGEQEAAFWKENEYGIGKLKDAMYRYGDQLVGVLKKYKKFDELRNSEDGDMVDPIIYETVKMYVDRGICTEEQAYQRMMYGCDYDSRYVICGIFGNWKIGDLGRAELGSDIEDMLSAGGDGAQVDLSKCVSVGYDIVDSLKNGDCNSALDSWLWSGENHSLCVEFHSVLVRLRNSNRWDEESNILEKEIMRDIWSKIILLEWCGRYEIPLITREHILGRAAGASKSFVSYAIVICVYIIYYNRINGIADMQEETIDETVDNIMNTIFQMGSQSVGLPTALDFFKAKNMKYSDVAERSSVRAYNFLLNTFTSSRRAIEKHEDGSYSIMNRLPFRGQYSRNVGVESVNVFESKDNHISALYTMVGLESVVTRDNKLYDSVKRQDRTKMLLQLNNQERSIYRKYEGEVLKLRADAIACKTPEVQRSLINRSVTIGKLIGIELEDSANDIYGILLLGLDSDRNDIALDLANRDFRKERNGMLYGQVATVKNWDY